MTNLLFNQSKDKRQFLSSESKYYCYMYLQYKPFIYKYLLDNNDTKPQYKYSGFCIDLFDRIAKVLDFTYEIYETPDTFFGSLKDDGSWNGAINELIEKVINLCNKESVFIGGKSYADTLIRYQ